MGLGVGNCSGQEVVMAKRLNGYTVVNYGVVSY